MDKPAWYLWTKFRKERMAPWIVNDAFLARYHVLVSKLGGGQRTCEAQLEFTLELLTVIVE